MRRIAIALALAGLAAPAGADEEEGRKAWWAVAEPSAESAPSEPDPTWWSALDEVVVLSGDPDPEPEAAAATPVDPNAIPVTRIVVAVPETRIVLYPSEGNQAPHFSPESLGPDAPSEGGAGRPVPADTEMGQPEEAPAADAAPVDGSSDPVAQAERRERDNECRRYRRQIPRYESELDLARERNLPRAEQALEAQVERLEARRDRRCPEDAGPDYAALALSALKTAAKVAAQAAIKAYTWGAF